MLHRLHHCQSHQSNFHRPTTDRRLTLSRPLRTISATLHASSRPFFGALLDAILLQFRTDSLHSTFWLDLVPTLLFKAPIFDAFPVRRFWNDRLFLWVCSEVKMLFWCATLPVDFGDSGSRSFFRSTIPWTRCLHLD